jgi:uncharacterized protein YecT (DUF1311 family)
MPSLTSLHRLAAGFARWIASFGFAILGIGAALAATPQIYNGPGDGAGVRLILHPQSATHGKAQLQFCDVGSTPGCGSSGSGTYTRAGDKLTLFFTNMDSQCIWSLHALADGKLFLDQSGPLDACQAYHGASFGWMDGVKFTPMAAAVASAHSGDGPAFDCAKATAQADKLVCGNAGLSAMDRQVATAYHAALHQAPNPQVQEQIKHAQIAWVHTKMRCRDVACLQSVYRERLGVLKHTATP